jgi:hypothetical protein
VYIQESTEVYTDNPHMIQSLAGRSDESSWMSLAYTNPNSHTAPDIP